MLRLFYEHEHTKQLEEEKIYLFVFSVFFLEMTHNTFDWYDKYKS